MNFSVGYSPQNEFLLDNFVVQLFPLCYTSNTCKVSCSYMYEQWIFNIVYMGIEH